MAKMKCEDLPLPKICPDCGFRHESAAMAEAVVRVREIHKPWGIYTECGHDHTQEELDDEASPVHEVDLVGLTCNEGLMYRVCRACCVEPGWAEGFQTETCATKHTHTPDGPVCPTVAALDGVEMPDEAGWT